MRYSSSKAASSSSTSSASYSSSPSSSRSRVGGVAMHYRKDGGLDMRYSSSKAAAASSPSSSSAGEGLHYRKDGGMDMRYRSSKAMSSSSSLASASSPLKKDGTPDMRYKSNRTAEAQSLMGRMNLGSMSGKAHPSHIKLTKAGVPDMRYKSSREYVQKIGHQASSSSQTIGKESQNPRMDGLPADVPTTKKGLPDMRTSRGRAFVESEIARGSLTFVPLTKSGEVDMSSAIGQACARAGVLPGRAGGEERRDDYWQERARDDEFQDALGDHLRLEELSCFDQQGPVVQGTYQDPAGLIAATAQATAAGDVKQGLGEEVEVMRSAIEATGSEEIDEGRLTVDSDSQAELGRGSFGVVKRATLQVEDGRTEVVAVKWLHLTKMNKNHKKSFVKELWALSTLGKHPNVVKLRGHVLSPAPAIVMEYVNNGTVADLLYYDDSPQNEAAMCQGKIKKKIIYGIAAAMQQLHHVGIVHGDLKPQNVLVNKNFVAKVTDFGLMRLRQSTNTTTNSKEMMVDEDGGGAIGTAAYMAPELLDNDVQSSDATDVYSFGILLNEIVSETQPYEDQWMRFHGKGVFAAAMYAKENHRPELSTLLSKGATELVERCWHKDPSKRPKFEEIVDIIATDSEFSISTRSVLR